MNFKMNELPEIYLKSELVQKKNKELTLNKTGSALTPPANTSVNTI